jgi:hypothetical protein
MNKPRSLDDLIAGLGDDPTKVKPSKRRSVRDAIIGLRERVGSKVFTKRQLLELVEAAYPELAPVAMANLDASLNRAKEYLELVRSEPQNIYRFKQPK